MSIQNLSVAEIILLLVYSSPDKKISGKTLLQKKLYFLAEMLNIPQLHFNAHYYGPYSPEVDYGLGKLKALSLINEQTENFGTSDLHGFDVRRYDYVLTKDGEEVGISLKISKTADFSRIQAALKQLESAGNTNDYVTLSIAAKAFYILKESSGARTLFKIKEAAHNLGWKIDESQIDKAIEFLVKADLVQTTQQL